MGKVETFFLALAISMLMCIDVLLLFFSFKE